MGHTGRRHACGRVNRVIVGLDKFLQNVYIYVCIFMCKVLVAYLGSSYEHVPRPHI